MATLQVIQHDKDLNSAASDRTEPMVDLGTIRRRVANIKRHWSPEIARARAIEGARRRGELHALLAELIEEQLDSTPADDHGFSLVG